MSDIQQYGWSQWGNMLDPAGGWVRHADHVAALAAQATAHINALAALTQEQDFLQQQVDDQATAHEAALVEEQRKFREFAEQSGYLHGVSDERARVRAGVETLFPQERYPDEHAAVLAVIDGEVAE